MKQLFTLWLFIAGVSLSMNATSITDIAKKGSVSGRVIDASLNQPLPYVNIIIKNHSGETITGGITDEEGRFKIKNIPEGKNIVDIQFIGFKTISKTIEIGKGNYNIDLGDIMLEEEASALEEVTVVAEVSTIQQKVDRKVITIGKDLTTSGATASDIMTNLPSVNVDQQTGNISLRGNENVRVMVDGKMSNVPIAQLLKQIPSTSIKQIELITNPSAKYNPEGMSGIINIILHKNTKLGFNGNINLGLTKEIFAKFNSSIDMNYRNGKFNFYGSYGSNISKYDNFGHIEIQDDNSRQDYKFFNNNKSHLFKVGVDYYLNDNNTISFFTNQNIFDGYGTGNTLLTYADLSQSQQLFGSDSDNNSAQYNLAYKHKFKKENETLDIELDYNDFSQDQIANFDYINFTSLNDYKDYVDTSRDQTTINIDYANPLSDQSKLELGAEIRLFNSIIDYASTGTSYSETGDIIPTPSTNFDYSRNIYSMYATYGKTLNKWSYQLGARVEQVNVDAKPLQTFADNSTVFSPFENDYFQIYPSAFITYNSSEKNSYQLSYSRRVDRPGLQQVNPIREWSTPRVSSFGNPELKPQFTNSIELNYTKNLGRGSLTTGVFYRIIEDQISRVLKIDRNNVSDVNTIMTYGNFNNTSAYGIEVSGNYRPTKWWNLNGSFDLYSQTQKGITEYLETDDIENATVDDIMTKSNEVENVVWNFRIFNNFRATKQLNLSLFAMYRGKEKSVQLNREPMFFVNTGLRYSFLEDNRATFSFNYNDIFNTMKFKFDGDTPYSNNGEFNWESNTWNIALSYRFGGSNYRALQRKKRENDIKTENGGFM